MRTRTRRLGSVLLGIALFIALVYGILFFAQDFVLFQPTSDLASWDYLLTQPSFEAVEIVSGEKSWHGMLRHAEGEASVPLILLFVGNGQNAAPIMRYVELCGMWPYFGNYACLVMDYAGYGINEGRASAKDMCEEALVAFDYASALPWVSGVIAGGYSIGTGPATYMAANREVVGLILLAPFSNSYDLYNTVLPLFYGPMRLFVKHRFLSDTYAGSVRVPALVVASRDDEVIPFASSEKLYASLGERGSFVTLADADHNSILFHQTTLESIRGYLDALEGGEP